MDEHTIVAQGHWLRLPLSQYWEIKLLDRDRIELRAWMVAAEEIELDRIQTNVMLSERYDKFSVNGVSGVLPPFKANIDEDWEVVHSGVNTEDVPGGSMTVSAGISGPEGLPDVSILPCGPSVTTIMNVVNSDLYHRGRVLQYLEKELKTLRPQEKVAFMARIVVQG